MPRTGPPRAPGPSERSLLRKPVRRGTARAAAVLVVAALALGAVPAAPAGGPRAAGAAALEGGGALAWGYHAGGQLGDGTTTNRSSPLEVPGVAAAVKVAAGRDHALALLVDGTVWGWGSNQSGQLGNGAVSLTNTPGPVAALTGATDIAAGTRHSLALKADGTVAAWGYEGSGALGGGTATATAARVPALVKDLDSVTAVAAGQGHSLALRSDGTVWAWGDNTSGQLGDGSTTTRLLPVQVAGLTNVRAIAARENHSFAIRNDGTVWGWGFNQTGGLGDGTRTDRPAPVRVLGLDRIIEVAPGNEHSLALRQDGTVWAWGANTVGALGDGTTDLRTVPVQARGPAAVQSIAAGAYESYALGTDWRVWAWGRGGNGQLGVPPTAFRATPQVIEGLNNVSSVAAGDRFAVATAPERALTATAQQQVAASGTHIAVDGGAGRRGGATLAFPPGALPSGVNVTLTSRFGAPLVLTPPGGATLVPRTLEVTGDGPLALSRTAEILVNLTPAELSGRDIARLSGAVVTGDTVQSRPTRIVDAAAGTLAIAVDHFTKFTLFEAKVAPPLLVGPPAGATLPALGVALVWANPPGVTQVHLQVVPFGGDGPGVDLIREATDRFVVPAPPEWYGLLPDLTYTWRVRVATIAGPATEADWSAWATGTFRTPLAGAGTIVAVAPAEGATVVGLTPQVLWANRQPGIFYYELQLSKDPDFVTDPARATAMVYGALVHGGVSNPANSYTVPAGFPLEPGTSYHWRVRPRVQGDGAPAPWTPVFRFTTP